MSEASSELRPRPVPLPRHPRAAGRRPHLDRRDATASSQVDVEPCYPLDPPLVDVRVPVKAPHAYATAYSRVALMHRFRGAEVGDDLRLLFSEPGKPEQSSLSPDVFVALKVPRRGTRADYDADELGPPDFILEVLSASTWKHDLGRKLDCYQEIGVRECLLFDVTGEDRAGTGKALWGYALTPGHRKPLEERPLPNGKRGVASGVLDLVAYVAERTPPAGPRETWALTMRWHDPATGADIPDYDQSQAEAQAQRVRADAERTRADAAQSEAQAARGEAETARSEAQAARSEALTARSEAQAAQRRAAELEARLRRLRGGH